ncbi:MAG: TPM domain-containing protein [Micrococcaceae bacterium]
MFRKNIKKAVATGAIATVSLFAFAPIAATAESPITLKGNMLIDQSGVLTSAQQQEIEAAQSKLYKKQGINLVVVYVDDFSNPSTADAWGEEVANMNSFGTKDVLLSVATKTHQANLNTSNQLMSSNTRDELVQEVAIPELKQGDYAQAALGIADDLTKHGGSSAGDSGAAPLGLLVAAGAGSYYYLRKRRSTQQQLESGKTAGNKSGLAALSTEELGKKAGALLVQTDDAVKTSQQELGFAEASYDEKSVAPFKKALQEAQDHLDASFKLQASLEGYDGEQTPDAQKRRAYVDIIHRCEAANKTLNEQVESFNELRKLESNIPDAITSINEAAMKLGPKLKGAASVLERLEKKYKPSAYESVKDNVTQAEDRLAFVGSAVEAAKTKVSQHDNGQAAVAVRAAEDAILQAQTLTKSVTSLEDDLDNANARLQQALNEVDLDLAEARANVASSPQSTPELPGAIARAETTVSQVKDHMTSGKIDPIGVLRSLQEAESNLEDKLNEVRDQQQQAQRATQQLDQVTMSAQTQIQAVTDYIHARRGGVGPNARTSLAEAQRYLDASLQVAQSDPTAALQYARQAEAAAAQANQLAQQDVQGFGMQGYGNRGGFGNGLGGAVLGGILINSILNSGQGGGNDDLFGGGGGFGGGFGGFDDRGGSGGLF